MVDCGGHRRCHLRSYSVCQSGRFRRFRRDLLLLERRKLFGRIVLQVQRCVGCGRKAIARSACTTGRTADRNASDGADDLRPTAKAGSPEKETSSRQMLIRGCPQGRPFAL